MTAFRPALQGLFAACCFWPLAAASGETARWSPAAVTPGPRTPSAEVDGAGALVLPVVFGAGDERAYWDFPLSGLPSDATAIVLELTCGDPSAIRGISLHLRRGDDWMGAEVPPPGSGRQTLFFDRTAFSPEQGQPFWREASGFRLSLWKAAARDSFVTLHAFRPWTHAVAVVRGSERTAPGETGLAAACATRARRLLDRAGIPSTIVDDDLAAVSGRRFRLLVLPYNPVLSETDIDILKRHVRLEGGRLLVFYHSDARLARLVGVRVRPYVHQGLPWTDVSFPAHGPMHLPEMLPHRTRHLFPVQADAPDAATLGCWNTPDGIPDRNLPACGVSPRGLWFSHIPPLAGTSAVQWLLASLARMDPSYTPARERHLELASGRDRDAGACLAEVPASAAEIRAAWLSPMAPRARREVVRRLADGGVQVLFELLSTAGYAHYRGDAPDSELGWGAHRPSASPTRNAAADKALGVALHAWVICWNLDGVPAFRIAALRKAGRLAQTRHGAELPWLCPSHRENRKFLLDRCRDLAERGVAGIHLDYLRYPGRDGCYSPVTRAAFEASSGHAVTDWPAEVLPGGARAGAFDRFRIAEMTSFVRDLAVALRDRHPAVVLSAAIFPTPATAFEHGQDGAAWLEKGGLDFLCPMLYTEDADRFAEQLDRYLESVPDPRRIVPGIGNSADESQLDALAVAQQIRVARERRVGGFAFFDANSDLTERILPALRKGIAP